MRAKLVPLALAAIIAALVGCNGGDAAPTGNQSMDSQLTGLKNGPMGGKNDSKAGGVTKAGATPAIYDRLSS